MGAGAAGSSYGALGEGLCDTSVTEVGATGEASQPLLPAEHQGAEKGLCAGSPRSEGV